MKLNYKQFVAGSLLMAMLVAIPATGFAKENNKDKNGERSENEHVKDRGCFRAFGHLIAPGWVKHNGSISIGNECNLPFGIGKKFRGDNATSTPPTPPVADTTAPVISGVTFRTAKMQAVVRWTTDERSDSTVFFGTSSTVNTSASTTGVMNRKALVKDHGIVLKNLTASTTYYLVVRSRDASGNTATSSTQSFMTKPPSVDTGAPVISNVVTVSSTSTIQVGWKTDENATGRVYYSMTLPVVVNASSTAFVELNTSVKDHVLTIPNLTNNTTYYLVIESTDMSGNVSTSATFSAVTKAVVTPLDTTAPIMSSIVSTVGTSTANVSWLTNENATGKVYYSTTTPLITTAISTQFVENTSLITGHSIGLTGLATSTLYHLLIESKDVANNTATSSEFSLTTGI